MLPARPSSAGAEPAGAEPTIAACATPCGEVALLRLSGPQAFSIAARAGITLPEPWQVADTTWRLAVGNLPCRLLAMPGPRSATGCDLVEITVPGGRDCIALGLDALCAAGAVPAPPGGFARQALAQGRLTLDRAEAIRAITAAGDAAAAAAAIARLRSALGDETQAVRERLLLLRASVEAGLDFSDEPDVRSFIPAALRAECGALAARLRRFCVTADAVAARPVVCLAGPANAGKSALFARLTGASALVSAVPGTTRDWLDAPWQVGGRSLRLIDTPGWLIPADGIDAAALERSRSVLASAGLILLCSAPDARLPDDARAGLPPGIAAERCVIIATKSDLVSAAMPNDPRARLAVSAQRGEGLAALVELVSASCGAEPDAEPRQQRLLGEAIAILDRLAAGLPSDELLAEDLRRAADALGDLLGATTPDDVLASIFSRFCIGK